MIMNPFRIYYCILAIFILVVESHYHDNQIPRGYGDIQQLLTYSNLATDIAQPTGQPSSVTDSSSQQYDTLNDPINNNVIPATITTIPPPTTLSFGDKIKDIDPAIDPFTNVEDGSIQASSAAAFSNSAAANIPPSQSNVVQYIWNVYNFSDILYSGQELVFSPRFYISEPGFRLQMLLITNTTYSDMVSYLGVFFRIVAGDYDSDVEWPYKYRTVLSVVKPQDLDEWTNKAVSWPGGKIMENLCTTYNYTVIPNIDECRLRSAFLRPNSDVEMSSNADGCGNRRYMPLTDLESDRYLRDDTLILALTVYLDSESETKTNYQPAAMSMRYNELVSNFVWSINSFSSKKNESVSNGKIVILNSEPFYTHPNGYLIQLFLTILPKRSAFAISIAFVQGDHDRYLQWPFPYPFEMAIVDQSPDYWKRDLTVKVKPSKSDCGTEPFGQPGPQPEFCFLTIQSLQVLSLTHYNFLLNDTLKIRFTTRFERYSSRQRSSILLKNNRLVSEFNWLIPGLVARFQRYINDPQGGTSGNLSAIMLRKTHRFVSDEFYTNGQGYLCQLVLTVSVKNLPIPPKNQSLMKDNSISLDQNEDLLEKPQQFQDVLVFSLELVIIEGEYDRFLDWPFNNAYELAIVGYNKGLNAIDNNNQQQQNESGGYFYFDKTSTTGTTTTTNSQLIIPLSQIESGQCSKESFQKPIKQNPPCGIKEFVQMDLGLSSTANDGGQHSLTSEQQQQQIVKQLKKFSKNLKNPLLMMRQQNDNNDKLEQHSRVQSSKTNNYELGSLSKTDEDLHLRVRIYL